MRNVKKIVPSRGSLPIFREPAIRWTRAAADDDALRHPLDHRDVVQGPPSGRLSRDGPPAARKRGRVSESAARLAPSLGVVSVVIGDDTARGDTRAYPPRAYTYMYLSLNARARARVDLRAPSAFEPGAVLAHVSLQASCQTLRKESFKDRDIFCAHTGFSDLKSLFLPECSFFN